MSKTWCDAVLALAQEQYDAGHAAENAATLSGRCGSLYQIKTAEWWVKANCHREFYHSLCALVARLNPQPGAPEAPARPW